MQFDLTTQEGQEQAKHDIDQIVKNDPDSTAKLIYFLLSEVANLRTDLTNLADLMINGTITENTGGNEQK